MKNKRSTRLCKFNARMMMCIIIIAMVLSMVFSTPNTALGDSKDKNVENATRSNFFINLIGNTVSALKPEKNKDDTSFIGKFSINALNIVNREVSFLTNNNLKQGNAQVQEQAQEVNNIVINPFKLNDGSINRMDAAVDIKGDPTNNAKKKILLYHSHTNEAYAEGNSGLDSTVAGVGDALTDELEKLGYTVIHDKTVHDSGDYNNAYYASRETLNKYISSYGDFDLIIDLHRDGGPAKTSVTGTIDGNNIAKLILVTTDQDPKYQAHLANMQSIVDISNQLYPDLFRGGEKSMCIYNHGGISYYNQDLSDNAILLEVGADTNNLQEAKNSMVYMSKVFDVYLNSK